MFVNFEVIGVFSLLDAELVRSNALAPLYPLGYFTVGMILGRCGAGLLTNRHGRAFDTWPLSSAACFYLDLGLAMDLVSSYLLLIEEGFDCLRVVCGLGSAALFRL